MALVDKRVVEMVFKNQDFEAKAQESMKTIDKLKDATKFDDSSSSIDRIAQAVEKLQDRFSTFGIIGKRVLENITDTAMHTAGKITNFLSSGVIGGGVKRAMNLENARFTMMSLYKDADKVAEAMDNVSASVDGTAYSLDQAALIATQFTGAGVEVGEELTNALKGLAGTAATYNADYASLGRVFASVASAGRVYGDDLLQLSTRGMPAAQVLADFFNNVAKGDESIKGVPEDIQNLTKSIAESSDKVADATNVTAGEIKELVSQGKINFDIFSQAMYTTFGENAAKANETFTGAMSNIKSALGRIGAGFVEPLIVQNGPLVNMFNAIRVKINEVKKGLVFDKEANNTEALSKRVTDFVIYKIDAITKKFENLDISKFLESFYNVFDGLISIFKAISSVITPIKEAFRDIFPKRSADDLVRITSKFKEFTAGIKVSETTIEKIKDIFTGLFGLLDAAKTIAIGFAKSFGPPIIAVLKSVMSWLLSVGSAFGRFFSSVRDVILALKESLKSPTDEITGLPSKIADAFKDNSAFTMVLRILTAFRDGVEKIMNSFRRIRGDGLKDATGEMTEELTIFGSILAGIKKLGESALAVLKTLKDVLSPILGWFADTIKGVVSKTMAVMGELDNDHTMNLIFEGGMGAIFVSIANAITNIGRGLGGGNGIGAAFASMLGKIGAAFKSVKAYMNAATLKLIADAILELVAAIFLLAIIPEKEAIRGLLIILAIVEILSLIMKKVQAMSTGIESSASYMMIGVAMMALASAILIVTAAIFIIAFMGYDNIVKGLLMISAICLVLTKTMKSITTNLDKASYKSIFGAAAVIASITAAILAITLSIAALTLLVKFLGIGNVAMALGVIVGIALTLGLAIKVMLAAVKNSEMSEFIKMVTTVVIVSAAIVLVATTVTALSIILGILPSSLITKGLLTLTAILLAVVAATLVLLIAFEDQAITDTLKAVSNFLLLAGAIVLISTAMVGIAALIGLIPTEWLVAGLFGMAAIITAIGLFYYALTKMADKMSFKDLAKAVLKFTAVVMVTVGLFGAMLIMAAAIGGVITILGSINIMEVSAFIISLLSVILVGALLSAKVPKFAEGLTGMAKALQTLSTAFLLFAIGARFAEQALIDLKDLTDEDIEHIKKNLSSFADAIAYAAPDIAYAIFSIFTSFVGAFMAFLVESIPLIFDQVVSTIVDSLGSIVNRVPDIVHIIWQVIYGVIEALRPLLGVIVDEVILLAIDLINALAKAIDKNSGPILDAIDRLLDSIIKLVVSAIFRMFGSTQEKTEKFLKKWKTTLRQVGKILIAAFAVAKLAGITKKFGGILTLIKKIGKALSTIKIGSGFTESAKKLTQEVAGDIEKGPLAKIKEFNKYFGGHGVLVTSIAAFAITAALLFKDYVDDMSVASTEANFLTESIEKQEEAYKKAYNREAAAGRDFEDSLRGQTREIRETDEKTNALLGSLEKYIDKNGKVKESARDTVENGLAYLNETYGTTYSLTDDLRILNGETEVSFKKLREEIDKTSAAQSATATLDQYKDEYEEAKDWLADAQNAVDLTELQALEEKALESYGESVDDLIKKRKDLGNAITNLDLYDDEGNPLQNWFAEMTTGDFVEAQSYSIQHLRKALELAGTDMAELDKQLSNSKGSLGPQALLQATIKDAVAYLEEQHTEIGNFLGDTKSSLEGLKESYERYSTMVINYEHLQKAQLSGNADAIREATISLEHNLGSQETMTKESLQRIFEEKQKAAQAEIKLYKNKTAGIRAIEVAGYLEAEYLAWKRTQEIAKTPAELAKQAAIEAKYLSQIKSLYDSADKAEEEAGWSVSDLIPDDAAEEAEEKASDVGDTIASSTVSSTNLGLKGGQSSVKKATEDSIASPVKDTVSDALKLGTATSIPFEQGAQTVLDYVNGMNSINTVKTVALSMLSTFLGDMQSSMNSSSPSVRPIVDLSALQNGAGVISTMLNGQRVTAANLNGKLSTQIAASINAEQFDVGIDKVIESIRHLNDNVVTLGNRVNKLQVVLDTGAMVGQLAPAMDGALGIRALRKGRGTI